VALTQSSPRPLTGRQRQVIAFVARGLTNKEIARELRITERGVSAHISRLLARFNSPNRASLIAQTIADQLGRPTTPDATADVLTDQAIVAGLEQELASYEDAPFLVGVTFGADQMLVYQNRMSRDLTHATEIGRLHREVFSGDANQEWWREKGNEAFVTGRPVAVASAPSRWQRRDGTWADAMFSCVAQPLRDRIGNVRGVLWICATAATDSPGPALDR
jgi:DNA-binding CsgD family transcriptional regulator